jgi:hypothetical protein
MKVKRLLISCTEINTSLYPNEAKGQDIRQFYNGLKYNQTMGMVKKEV